MIVAFAGGKLSFTHNRLECPVCVELRPSDSPLGGPLSAVPTTWKAEILKLWPHRFAESQDSRISLPENFLGTPDAPHDL